MADTVIKLKYGMRDGKIVSINEISEDEKGLRCNCVCPNCGIQLQARIGTGKRQPHFAHNNERCDFQTAQQTALHLLAKEIIEEERKVLLPPVTVDRDELRFEIGDYHEYRLPKKIVIYPEKVIKCDRVLLEKRVSNIVPDIILEFRETQLLIEIAVTHFVDEEKLMRVRQLGLPMIEVDLSDLCDGECTRDGVKKILFEQSDRKRWIFNPKEKEIHSRGVQKYNELLLEQKKIIAQEERKRAEQEHSREQKRIQAAELIKRIKTHPNYQNELLRLRNDNAAYQAIQNRSFYIHNMEIPFFMDIPITGEVVFNCDRRIWQSAIFDKFIFNRNTESGATVHVKRVFKWFTDHQKEIELRWELVPQTFLFTKNSGSKRSLLTECIKQYLVYMYHLGFISEVYYHEADVLCAHALQPPNAKASAELQAVIHQVDQFQWDVTDRIYAWLHPERSVVQWDVFQAGSSSVSEHESEYRFTVSLEEARQVEYDSGRREIIDSGLFETQDNPKDSFGFRWKRCEHCEKIKREDEMISYQGKTGLCRDCEKR